MSASGQQSDKQGKEQRRAKQVTSFCQQPEPGAVFDPSLHSHTHLNIIQRYTHPLKERINLPPALLCLVNKALSGLGLDFMVLPSLRASSWPMID